MTRPAELPIHSIGNRKQPSKDSRHSRINHRPQLEITEKHSSGSLFTVITDRSCITPQTRPVVQQYLLCNKNSETHEMGDPTSGTKNGRGCFGWGCLITIIIPFIFFFIPLPETPIKAYPVYGKSSFDVLQHKVILSLGAFEEAEQSRYGMKRRFRVWVDVPNGRWSEEPVTIKCSKIEYRMNESEWREADRTPEGDYRGGGSARIWYWSPIIQDLELIDPARKSYKMRPGRYDLRVVFESAEGAHEAIETTLTLGEKTERHWTSVREILEELSGIN